MDDKEELKTTLLIKECDSVGQKINSLFLSGEKILALGFTVIAAGMTIGINDKISLLLLVLPIAVFGIVLYGINIFTEMLSLGGYKRYLEEKINETLGENVLLWELSIAKERHGSFSKKILYLVYSLFVGFTMFISLSTAWKHYTEGTFWAAVIVILLLVIGSIISLYEMKNAFIRTYQIAIIRSKEKSIITSLPNSQQKE